MALLLLDGRALLVRNRPVHLLASLLVGGAADLVVIGPVAGLGDRPALLAIGGRALGGVGGVVDGAALGAVAGRDSADEGDGEETESENLRKGFTV